MVKAQVWRYVKAYDGDAREENIKFYEEILPPIGNGEILLAAEFLSVDPYMRLFPPPVGEPMIGEQVARVTESKNSKYVVGSKVLINSGWRSHTIVNPDKTEFKIKPLPSGLKGLPESLALGTIGMPGATAYFALFKALQIKHGKTILVNAASGAVGQVAGQIAKLKGLKTIGAAGSKEKCDFLKQVGFDIAINYKTDNLSKALSASAPEGIDFYIDMVGGQFTNTVIKDHMARGGRMCSIGDISGYGKLQTGELLWGQFFLKELTMEGLLIYSDRHTVQEWDAAFDEMTTWIKQGKLRYKEDVTEGFQNMLQAFLNLFKGQNFGKAVVRV